MMLQNIGAQAVLRNWWMLALRGVLAIIFDILFIVRSFQLRSWASHVTA